MMILVTILHVIACLGLIGVILIQAGRGGGLSEMLGGGVQQSQKMFGTKTSTVMTRATTYCAILFIITSITLGLMTSRRSRSLMEGAEIQPLFDATTVPSVTKEKVPATETFQSNFQPKAESE